MRVAGLWVGVQAVPGRPAGGLGDGPAAAAGAALAAGAAGLCLCPAGAPDRAALAVAQGLAALCRERGAHLLVAGRADLAACAGASGVLLGPSDLPVEAARRLLGPGGLVAAVAAGEDEAAAALAGGAGCLVVPLEPGSAGPVVDPDGVERVRAVVAAAQAYALDTGRPPVPVLAAAPPLAGTGALLAAGAAGLLVPWGALAAGGDPAAALRALVAVVREWDGHSYPML